MSGVTKVPTAARVEALELRASDLALAVLELANIVERLVVGGKHWKGEERQAMLTAVDNARALATPESDDDPEPEPASAAMRPPAGRGCDRCARVGRILVLDSNTKSHEETCPDCSKPEPPAAGARLRRYGIDLKSGEITDTDDLAEAREMYFSGSVLNILDRESGVLLVYRGRIDAPTLLLAAEAA